MKTPVLSSLGCLLILLAVLPGPFARAQTAPKVLVRGDPLNSFEAADDAMGTSYECVIRGGRLGSWTVLFPSAVIGLDGPISDELAAIRFLCPWAAPQTTPWANLLPPGLQQEMSPGSWSTLGQTPGEYSGWSILPDALTREAVGLSVPAGTVSPEWVKGLGRQRVSATGDISWTNGWADWDVTTRRVGGSFNAFWYTGGTFQTNTLDVVELAARLFGLQAQASGWPIPDPVGFDARVRSTIQTYGCQLRLNGAEYSIPPSYPHPVRPILNGNPAGTTGLDCLTPPSLLPPVPPDIRFLEPATISFRPGSPATPPIGPRIPLAPMPPPLPMVHLGQVGETLHVLMTCPPTLPPPVGGSQPPCGVAKFWTPSGMLTADLYDATDLTAPVIIPVGAVTVPDGAVGLVAVTFEDFSGVAVAPTEHVFNGGILGFFNP